MPVLPKIYLASQSPRRRELLAQIGVTFEVLRLRERPGREADVDEAEHAGELPDAYVLRVAQLKARAASLRLQQRSWPPMPILAADTTVCIGERILGKPTDASDARTMLRGLSDRSHRVFTAVAVQHAGRLLTALSQSTVRFRRIEEDEIDAYVASGEPMDKAGAYAIQGGAQAFVPAIEGSYSGIVGLPLCETVALLREITR